MDDDGRSGRSPIGSKDVRAVEEARRRIELILDPPTAEVGAEYTGRVVNITKFGAFVNILPGADGLLHISKLGQGKRIDRVEDVLNLGDERRACASTTSTNTGKLSLSLVGDGDGDGGGGGGSSRTSSSGNGAGDVPRAERHERPERSEARSESPRASGGGSGRRNRVVRGVLGREAQDSSAISVPRKRPRAAAGVAETAAERCQTAVGARRGGRSGGARRGGPRR